MRCAAASKAENMIVIVLNFANCDMVGHTGVLPAAIQAVEAVDDLPGAGAGLLGKDGRRQPWSQPTMAMPSRWSAADGTPFTAHTTNEVPF